MEESRNRSLWFGPLLALFGLLSYFTVFYRWPALRDFPWLNLALLLVAIAVSWNGMRQARASARWKRVAGALGIVVSITFTALLCFYCFKLSYGLPAPDLALTVDDPVPAITLKDNRGRDVDIASDERTLLVFYRGHW